MDKENVKYVMEYYSELKRENSVICDNVDDPGVHRAK
jgi:hypothetical protein